MTTTGQQSEVLRQGFEKWARSRRYALGREEYQPEHYEDDDTQIAWHAWQGCAADQLAATPQQVPVGYVALAALKSRAHADDYAKCFATEAALLENYPAAKVIAVFDHAATQPAAQGIDASTSIGTLWVEENGANDLELCPCAAPKLPPGEYALFAQAKQGDQP